MTATRRWLLAFDASTPRCVAVVGHVDDDGDTCVASEALAERPNQASARLAPGLHALLAEAGIGPGDLAAVACGRGPGTFTGTRVALATAMGLCLGAGCPALPLSTLEVVAASHDGDGEILALLDARREEVYAASFTASRDARGRRTFTRTSEERCVGPAALVADLAAPSPTVAIGPGVAPYRAVWTEAGLAPAAADAPTPAGLWAAAAAAWRRGEATDPANLRAVYLRRSYAELGVNRPKRKFVRSPFV